MLYEEALRNFGRARQQLAVARELVNYDNPVVGQPPNDYKPKYAPEPPKSYKPKDDYKYQYN